MNIKKMVSLIKPIFLVLYLILSFLLCSTTSYADDEEPDNGIPVVYITIDESQGSIDDMINSPDHSVYCYGSMSIEVSDGFHYCDMPMISCDDLSETSMSIKGRGNSTWSADKKPFKVKLDTKTDVLGLGANKHWVLLASAYDRTLIRNRITAWLGDEIGMPYTPRGVPVDLVMKNTDGTYQEYLGSYYLCEQVRVGTNRIEIEELDEDDTSSDIITGGYVVQIGTQTDNSSPNYFKTASDDEWANHTPNFDPEDGGYVNDIQKNYIRDYMQDVEDAIYNANYDGTDGTSYRDMMDLTSAAKYWLVMEACLNGDAYGTGSTYLYKDRDTKLYWGPLWDFDYAWYYEQNYDKFAIDHTWIKGMLYDTGSGGFVEEIKKSWPEVKTALLKISEDGGMIDKYYEETKLSQEDDLKLYPIKDEEYAERKFEPAEDKELFKAWINNRVAWMDAHMNDLDTIIHKVDVVVDGEEVYHVFIQDGHNLLSTIKKPKKSDYLFIGWEDANGNPIDDEKNCTEDTTIIATFVSKEEATQANDIYFQYKEDYVLLEDGMYSVLYSIVPEDAQNKDITWTTSNSETASLDEYGNVILHSIGDVTITGTLDSGASQSILLHIIDEDLPEPEAVTTDREVYELKVGEYGQIILSRTPANARVLYRTYKSSDTSIVTANDEGLMHAVAPGTAEINVIAEYYDLEGILQSKTTTCKVIVTEADSGPVEYISYTVAEGDGQVWYRGSGAYATFTFKRSVDDGEAIRHFSAIKIDGKAVSNDNYSVESGSIVLKLKPEYLKTLPDGKHKLSVSFDDGEDVDVFFTVITHNDNNKSDDSRSDDTNANGDTTIDKKSNDGSAGNMSNTDSKQPAGSAIINTGDTSYVGVCAVMMILSLLVIICIIMIRVSKAPSGTI